LYPFSTTQIELLQLLVQIASENNLGEGVIVKIKFNIIASLYDYNPNLATYMKVGQQRGASQLVGQEKMLNVLSHRGYGHSCEGPMDSCWRGS
jgi:hypothetical protein